MLVEELDKLELELLDCLKTSGRVREEFNSSLANCPSDLRRLDLDDLELDVVLVLRRVDVRAGAMEAGLNSDSCD